MRNKKSFLTFGIIALVLFLGVGYAVVSSVYLNIGGTANVANSELKVEITNVEAETNMTDKTLDFTNVLSNNNLTSNFTLKNMSLNELVTITYTVTNNEKDVDAIISAIDGVDLTNSNSNCFDVNYQITDNETDLENNDKTMEVVVTVELIKTPLNDDESTTNVGLTLAAIPKGVDPSTIKPPSGTSDVLDNAWPIEWDVMEVNNNTSLEEGYVVRVSKLAPTLSELQESELVVTLSFEDDLESFSLFYLNGANVGQGCYAEYALDSKEQPFAIYSAPVAGDYKLGNVTITVDEPGLYVYNVYALLDDVDKEKLEELSFEFKLVKQKSYVPYYISATDYDIEGLFDITFEGDRITMTPNNNFFNTIATREELINSLENDEVKIGVNSNTVFVDDFSYDLTTLSFSFGVNVDELYFIEVVDVLGCFGVHHLPIEETNIKFNTLYTLNYNYTDKDYPKTIEFDSLGNCYFTYENGNTYVDNYGKFASNFVLLDNLWSTESDGNELVITTIDGYYPVVYTVEGFETEKFMLHIANYYTCIEDNILDDDIVLDTKIKFYSDGSGYLKYPDYVENVNYPSGYFTYKNQKITNSENDYYMIVSDDGNTITEYRDGTVAYVWKYD